jgi:hypothetical protein
MDLLQLISKDRQRNQNISVKTLMFAPSCAARALCAAAQTYALFSDFDHEMRATSKKKAGKPALASSFERKT